MSSPHYASPAIADLRDRRPRRVGTTSAGTAVNDGGIVIDLSMMKGIQVDPERRVARAQAGVVWGELDRETQRYGSQRRRHHLRAGHRRFHPLRRHGLLTSRKYGLAV